MDFLSPFGSAFLQCWLGGKSNVASRFYWNLELEVKRIKVFLPAICV